MYPGSYNERSLSYTLQIPAKDAHIFIWGGSPEECERVEREMRATLVNLEDQRMPDEHYVALFNEPKPGK